MRANYSFRLHHFDFRARVFHPAKFLFRRRTRVAGREPGVQITQPAPSAELFFRVAGPQDAGIFDGKFQRHRLTVNYVRRWWKECNGVDEGA